MRMGTLAIQTVCLLPQQMVLLCQINLHTIQLIKRRIICIHQMLNKVGNHFLRSFKFYALLFLFKSVIMCLLLWQICQTGDFRRMVFNQLNNVQEKRNGIEMLPDWLMESLVLPHWKSQTMRVHILIITLERRLNTTTIKMLTAVSFNLFQGFLSLLCLCISPFIFIWFGSSRYIPPILL